MSRLEDRIRRYRRLGIVFTTITFLFSVTIFVCGTGRVSLGVWGYILGYGAIMMGVCAAGCFLTYRDLHRRRLRGNSKGC
ncbi:MAG: hypothetical protein IH987_17645 [Planctomycetes bacterium]|nr:hypothetical protein [Planctomycetota bacterium]